MNLSLWSPCKASDIVMVVNNTQWYRKCTARAGLCASFAQPSPTDLSHADNRSEVAEWSVGPSSVLPYRPLHPMVCGRLAGGAGHGGAILGEWALCCFKSPLASLFSSFAPLARSLIASGWRY